MAAKVGSCARGLADRRLIHTSLGDGKPLCAERLSMLVGISCPETSNNCGDSLAVPKTCQGPRLPAVADNTWADLRGQTALCVLRQRRSPERLSGAGLTGSAWPPSPDRGTATLVDMSEVTYTSADGIGRQAAGLAA